VPYSFKIWNQGNDGRTMGVRVQGVRELAKFAAACTEPDISGRYVDMQFSRCYTRLPAATHGSPPSPYARIVDVIWLNPIGYGSHRLFPGRTLVATYIGPLRTSGGFASQCYCIVDANGYPALAKHHRAAIRVEYVADPARDVLVVMP
jgi:hypothetical protein